MSGIDQFKTFSKIIDNQVRIDVNHYNYRNLIKSMNKMKY